MLFEQNIKLYGKHAKYLRFLKDIGLFQTHRGGYLYGAVIGLIYNKKVEQDNSKDDTGKVETASIFAGDIGPAKSKLIYIYRLIMLIDEVDGYTIKDYQDRTFKYDADEKKYKEQNDKNMEIFESYVRGGLEIIYNKFKDCKNENEIIDTLYELLNDFMKYDIKIKEIETI